MSFRTAQSPVILNEVKNLNRLRKVLYPVTVDYALCTADYIKKAKIKGKAMKNKTTHKILTALLAALLCLFPLAACNGGGGAAKNADGSQFDFAGNYQSPETKIDGKDDDGTWAALPVLARYGKADTAVAVKAFRGVSALFMFFEVYDPCLLTQEGDAEAITFGDSVEIYLDTKLDGGEKPQTDDFQFNLGIDGRSRILRGTGAFWTAWNGLIDHAVDLIGTLNDGTAANDMGYRIEAMIPYAQVGLTPSAAFGISFGQVDKWGANNVLLTDWNWYPFIWEGLLIEPQRPANYVVFTVENTLAIQPELGGKE
jgi:hypothetical protein